MATTVAAGGASNAVVVGISGTDAGVGLAEDTLQQGMPAGAACTVMGAAWRLISGHSGHAALIPGGAQQDANADAGVASTAMAASSPTNFATLVTERWFQHNHRMTTPL